MNLMLLGAIAMACFVVTLFFLRFWRQTGDRFFLIFALAFLVEAFDRISLGVLNFSAEYEPLIYGGRLVTYALIIIAIIDYNRKPPNSG
jgi:hypothetical protein